ncbi:hypothetical protein B5M06_06325 [Comamonas kerstersii]|jgi:LPS-assembly lipoprotein|uniref:LPS-assembly lipoprotein LptE n=1 Tax=Comamonas kerstersii TaxID=225992 RepID=A0A1V0BDA4_9BURK|nr:LPS assembly lipoprotein LptE [Comamonas kerstersii]AQZ97938.1 hypothetical protein B5M06_06325 [Comamonas kerstersii]HBW62169.1 hypothetical protein [Comamonas kerstersii]
MRKRTLLSLMALAPVVSACGFRLRGVPTFPFSSLYLQAPEGSPLTREVLRHLATAGSALQIVLPPAASSSAQVTLRLLGERRERIVLAKTVSGQVREVELRLTTRFSLVDNEGRIWIEDAELSQKRDMSYSETLALAKDEEEAALYRNMYADMAQQILRRLQAAHPPAGE